MKYDYIKVYFVDENYKHVGPVIVHDLQEIEDNLSKYTQYVQYTAVGHINETNTDEVYLTRELVFFPKTKKLKMKRERKI